MIQSNELRKNNLVDWNGEIAKISQLLELEVVFKCGETDLYTALNPIPLTEEILLKCGFVKGFDNFYRKNKSYMIEICFFDKGILVTNQSVCLSGIKHLHQLQNLYFALTCKELEINLKS
jgi:hypothetical protein